MRGLLLVIAVLVTAPSAARAYPQLQFSTDHVRCGECHFAPAGGGLLADYGREEAGDVISRGGDGRFLHGRWTPPSWLALGGDLRLAGLVHDQGDRQGITTAVFPMQADVYLRAAVDAWSAYVNVGYRGATRPVMPSLASRFVSREHYLMWRDDERGWYLRAGRFFAPYGLRLHEHTAYVRRFLGFNLLEEPYALSGGFADDRSELHVTAFAPDFVRAPIGPRGAGVAAFYERRVATTAAYGAQAKVTIGDADRRATGGAIGKLYLARPRVQLLAEADLVRQTFAQVDAPRWQLLGYLGAAWFPTRGLIAQLTLERWDQDLGVSGLARSAAGVHLQWFPTAHVELSLWGRVAMVGSGDDDGPLAKTLLLQLHYYL